MGFGLGFPSFGAQHGGHTSHQPDLKWDRIWLSVESRGWERAEDAPLLHPHLVFLLPCYNLDNYVKRH